MIFKSLSSLTCLKMRESQNGTQNKIMNENSYKLSIHNAGGDLMNHLLVKW